MVFQHVSIMLFEFTDRDQQLIHRPHLSHDHCWQRYYQCLAVFPSVYNYFYEKWRKKSTGLFLWTLSLLLLNGAIVSAAWFSTRYMEGYNHYNVETGEKNLVSSQHNLLILITIRCTHFQDLTVMCFHLFSSTVIRIH